MGKSRYVVCKNEEGQVQAFHNVCRHHAAAVVSGSGCTHSFVCPYHVNFLLILDTRRQFYHQFNQFTTNNFTPHPIILNTLNLGDPDNLE